MWKNICVCAKQRIHAPAYYGVIFAALISIVLSLICGSLPVLAAQHRTSPRVKAHKPLSTRAPSTLTSPALSFGPRDTSWTLTFGDEFNASSLNTSVWNIADAGPGGYRGCCLSTFGSQAFTMQDVALSQGMLQMTSEKRSLYGKNYTSGAITTENKFSLLYGRVDISARVPSGQGMWPALWMLTGNADHETDLMETINSAAMLYQTLHLNNPSYNTMVYQCNIPETDLSAAFHLYSLIWTPSSIIWYFDGTQTCQITDSVPQTPMYLLLDNAVGGSWPGEPNSTTVFPQYTYVDYVHVYQAAPYTDCLGLQVTTPLQILTPSVALGQTVYATVTYTNNCTLPFSLNNLIVAARAPDGSNADFGNKSGPVTIQPGQSLTVNASRYIKLTDPPGQWYAFSSFLLSDGTWHPDGTNLEYFTVTG